MYISIFIGKFQHGNLVYTFTNWRLWKHTSVKMLVISICSPFILVSPTVHKIMVSLVGIHIVYSEVKFALSITAHQCLTINILYIQKMLTRHEYKMGGESPSNIECSTILSSRSNCRLSLHIRQSQHMYIYINKYKQNISNS